MERDIDPRREHRGGALAQRTAERLHRQVVGHDQSVKPDVPRMIPSTTIGDIVAGLRGSIAL